MPATVGGSGVPGGCASAISSSIGSRAMGVFGSAGPYATGASRPGADRICCQNGTGRGVR